VIPVGDDVPTYVWRTRAVAAGGLDALDDANHYPFHSNTANPGRPGYPVLSTLVEDATGVTSWRLPFVLPAAGAIAIGLAAAAFAVWGLGEPLWSFPLYTIVVGTSANVAITANGYFDNLLVDATILAALAAALLLLAGRKAGAAVAFLVAGTAVVHWQFGIALVGMLVLLMGLALPESLRSDLPWRRRPSARLGGATAVGGAVGFGGLLLLTPGLGSVGTNTRRQFERILDRQGPLYAYPLTGPIAAVGAVALGAEPGRQRRRGLVLLLAWAGVAAAAYLAFQAGVTLAAQRMLGFALAVPILMGAAVVGAVRLLGRVRGRTWKVVGRIAACLVVAVAVVATFALGLKSWDRTVPYEVPRTHGTIGAFVDYLHEVPPGTPIVVVVQQPATRADFGLVPALRRIRAQLPPERIDDLYVYLGTPGRALKGEPSIDPGRTIFNSVSRLYWPIVQPVLDRHPVIVALHAFFGHFPRFTHLHPQWPVSRDGRFLVAQGPPLPAQQHKQFSPKQQPLGRLIVGAVLVLLVMGIAGLGWSTLLPVGWGARGALAPAFGISALAIGGLAADRVGMGLSGAPGLTVAAVVAAVGWAPFAVAAIRRRRVAGRPEPATDADGEAHEAAE
jgi:hypothetical protein